MKDVPTVNNAELTLTEALANPVIVVFPAASVVMPDAAPAIVSELPPCIEVVTLANPVIVVLPAASVVIPDTAPLKLPVLADITQRCVEFPNKTVLDEGVKLVPDITRLPDRVLESVF